MWHSSKGHVYDTAQAQVILIWAWILFIFNQVFLNVIMLNFLIAIISQSYEHVMTNGWYYTYTSICQFNATNATFKDSMDFFWARKPVKIQVFYIRSEIQSNQEENSSQEFLGFIRTIKKTVS